MLIVFAPGIDPTDENTRLSVHSGSNLEVNGFGSEEQFAPKKRMHFPPMTVFEVLAISETPDLGIFRVTTPDLSEDRPGETRILVCRRAGFTKIMNSCEPVQESEED